MQEHVTFIRDDVLPSYWANRLQQLLSTYTDFILSQATPTSIQIVAGPNDQAAICTIAGKWRFVEASVTRAHPGGAAGTYDIFAVTAANDVDNVPDPFSDHTDYAFGLSIVAHNTTPPIVAGVVDLFRKIGECKWDGVKITKVTQLVGVAPPDTQLVVGDVKLSLQAADHPGWIKMDGRATLARADYPAEVSALMDSLGLHGVDGAHFAVPDGQGRMPIGVGTVAAINALGKNDGTLLSARGPAHLHSMPNHSHLVPITSGKFAGDFTWIAGHNVEDDLYGATWGVSYLTASNRSGGPGARPVRDLSIGDGDLNVRGLPVEYWGANTSPGGSSNTFSTTIPFLALNLFVFTGEGTAASGGTGGGGGGGVGPPNVRAANYTLQETDVQHVVEMNAAGATVVTVPTDAHHPMAVGTIIEVARMGAGAVTLAAEGGVTLRSQGGLLGIGHQYGTVSLRKRATDEWHVVGDLA